MRGFDELFLAPHSRHTEVKREDIESKKHDEILPILESFEQDAENPRYRERDNVTLCGMLTAKTVKNTRNGAGMAFLTLEDRYAEIEIIVFPKQYEKYQDALITDTAVRVSGSLTEREDEGVKVIASEIAPLRANGTAESTKPSQEEKGKTLYLRVSSLQAPETREALEILRFSSGKLFRPSTCNSCRCSR